VSTPDKPDLPRGWLVAGANGGNRKSLRVRPRKAPWIPWLAAAAVGGLVIGGLVSMCESHVAKPPPDSQTASQARALRLRDEAYETCARGQWAACLGKLDGARELDPAGESDPRVTAARAAIVDTRHPEPGIEKAP
jgi:hypothetical protein